MQRTLVLLKPDCLEGRHCGEVIGRLERAGLTIVACELLRLDEALLREHYAHLAKFDFFEALLEFMRSGPVIAMVWEGKDAIARVRALVGPTDSRKAPAGTIRGDLGTDNRRNLMHASDSPESARVEICRFFSEEAFPPVQGAD